MNTSTDSHIPSTPLRALLALCALAVVSQLYWPLPVLPQVARAHGLTPGAAGMVVSAFGMAYAAGFLLFGPLSDRLGRRAVMAWGLAALAPLTAALAWAPSSALLAGRALQGLAAAAFAPAAIAYLSERGTPRQRTWGVAWISTAFLSAGLLGQMYGGAVAGRWGLGAAMLPLAAVYAITACALLRTPADARAAARALPSLRASIQAMSTLLADARLRRA
ncbi:MAG: MFS transporter, partial [Comamonadaceae bacterium]|nr:MFS transporter [Comamonadaceae bacterium]